ncbi:MAG: DUF1152 domain-containing protein [Halobacteriales archaeon]
MEPSLDAFAAVDRALVFGLGGGGDVVSAIPTVRLLETVGVEVTVGGVSWVPMPRDVRPGPRSLDELRGVDPIAERVGLVDPGATTIDDVPLPEGGVASHVENRTLVLDMSAGVGPLLDSVGTVVEDLAIEAVVGVDAGGDALAVGDEPGVVSPLTDAVGLAVLDGVDRLAALGVLGYGSDGELEVAELETAFAALARSNALLGAWGITPAVRAELEELLEDVETEASRVPVEAAAGAFGQRSVRGGASTVQVGPATPVTYYFDPSTVIERSTVVEVVRDASSLEAAAERLRERGVQTEFETERERAKRT